MKQLRYEYRINISWKHLIIYDHTHQNCTDLKHNSHSKIKRKPHVNGSYNDYGSLLQENSHGKSIMWNQFAPKDQLLWRASHTNQKTKMAKPKDTYNTWYKRYIYGQPTVSSSLIIATGLWIESDLDLGCPIHQLPLSAGVHCSSETRSAWGMSFAAASDNDIKTT